MSNDLANWVRILSKNKEISASVSQLLLTVDQKAAEEEGWALG